MLGREVTQLFGCEVVYLSAPTTFFLAGCVDPRFLPCNEALRLEKNNKQRENAVMRADTFYPKAENRTENRSLFVSDVPNRVQS